MRSGPGSTRTETAVRGATKTLRQVLAPLGIEPELEIDEFSEAAFLADPRTAV
jgi:hypothetical protein